MNKNGPDVYKYLDFRKFLKEVFKERKQRNQRLSVRGIALKAGIDPSLFAKVLKGERKLVFDDIMKLADAIGLDKSQKIHFEQIARFTQSKSQNERKQLFQKISMRQKRKIATLAADHFEYFNRWYIPVIRELLNFYPYRGDNAELARILQPPISLEEAKQAINILIRIGVIVPGKSGSYILSDPFISPSADLNKTAIHNFQISMLDLAKQALSRFSKNSRDISTLTMSLSKNGFARVRERIVEFRQELMDIARNDSDISGVYQFNFQTFPMTEIPKQDTKR